MTNLFKRILSLFRNPKVEPIPLPVYKPSLYEYTYELGHFKIHSSKRLSQVELRKAGAIWGIDVEDGMWYHTTHLGENGLQIGELFIAKEQALKVNVVCPPVPPPTFATPTATTTTEPT